MENRLLLKNGRVWDNQLQQWVKRDVRIEGGRIQQVDAELSVSPGESVAVLDLNGNILTPGFVDPHVHFRSPGLEYKETIATGSQSAAKGGYTAVVCMPNTKPALDTAELMEWIKEQGEQAGFCRVFAYGAITAAQKGQELTDFASLKSAGAVGFTDDGVGIQSGGMMREAMRRAAHLGLPIVTHSEDETLSGSGCMNESEVARRLGLSGIPGVAESSQVARDVVLAADTGAHLHICHISDRLSIEAVRFGKTIGVRVTAEVTPHHLLLTDEQITGADANFKVNPPLRSAADRKACIQGLLDGTIDMIATDHAPHSDEEKQRSFAAAPFGFVGLELAFPLLYTHFVRTGQLSIERLLDLLSAAPAAAFGLPVGELRPGGLADLTVLDLNRLKQVDPAEFLTLGKNTPFVGQELYGWPILTIMDGRVTWQETAHKEVQG
ncbi:MAG: dihydroorotase, multifunctional complex type [Bacilli bacterium]|nr:dihydroorotase, multifunctional complex type [Bacilli bacterium]